MRPFRVRDLMVNVIAPGGPGPGPGPGGCGGLTFPNCGLTFPGCGLSCAVTDMCGLTLCAALTPCAGASRCPGVSLVVDCDAGPCSLTPCTDGCSRCTENATPCHTPTTKIVGFVSDAELGRLKVELRDALSQVEGEEQGREQRQRPGTIEEIEELEGHVRAALEELRARRRELGG